MRYIYYTIIVVIFSGCNNRQSNNELLFKNFPEKISFQGGEPLTKVHFFDPQQIFIVDSCLIIRNGSSVFFQFLNTNSNKLISEFGNKGKGPKEFIDPILINQVVFNNHDKNISFVDTKRRQYVSIPLKNIYNYKSEDDLIINKLNRTIPRFFSCFGKSESKFYFIPIEDGLHRGRFYYFDDTKNTVKYAPYKPELGYDIHPDNLYPVYNSTACINEELKIIALAPYHMGEIDFFDFNGKYLRSTIFERPDYLKAASENKLIYDYNPLYYYGIVKSFKDRIYALRFNVHLNVKDDNLPNSFIDVYNWNGKPILTIEMDKFISDFAVDELNNRLYCICPLEPEYSVFFYNNFNE